MTIVLTIAINVFIAVSRVLGLIPILRLLAPARLHHLRVLLSRLVYELYPSPPCFHLTSGTLDTDLLLWFTYQHVPNAVGNTVFVHVVALPGGLHGVFVRFKTDVAQGMSREKRLVLQSVSMFRPFALPSMHSMALGYVPHSANTAILLLALIEYSVSYQAHLRVLVE
jgi:hypothetical protein